MRPVFPFVVDDYSAGYETPDGRRWPTIAAACRHVAPAAPVAALAITPVLPRPAFDRLNELLQLKRELRRAELELSAVPSIPAAPWSPVHRWNAARKARFAFRVRRLRRLIAAHRSRYGIAEQRPWKPRPATAADRRIERQFSPEATPIGWHGITSARKRSR